MIHSFDFHEAHFKGLLGEKNVAPIKHLYGAAQLPGDEEPKELRSFVISVIAAIMAL